MGLEDGGLLEYVGPDFVHVLVRGRIAKSGDKGLALELTLAHADVGLCECLCSRLCNLRFRAGVRELQDIAVHGNVELITEVEVHSRPVDGARRR